MLKFYVRKRKMVAGTLAALMAGSAFQATGCSVNLDQQFLQTALQAVLDSGVNFGGGFHVGLPRGGGPHGEQPDDDSGGATDPAGAAGT